MGIADYFKKVNSMTVEEVREFLKTRDADSYNLIDVRQPVEYEQGHIPGAQLIPVGDLHARLGDMDPAKPAIAY